MDLLRYADWARCFNFKKSNSAGTGKLAMMIDIKDCLKTIHIYSFYSDFCSKMI